MPKKKSGRSTPDGKQKPKGQKAKSRREKTSQAAPEPSPPKEPSTAVAKPRGPQSDTKESHETDEVEAEAPAEPPGAGDEGGKLVVVGIGASAGGLEAISDLLRNLAHDSMCFIVVQHLPPEHSSMLTPLLARCSTMPVETATDGTALVANRVYVIPPNADLAVMHGVLHVLTQSPAYGPRLPVDYLFRSLAEDQGHRAVGVVLSGTGMDGTIGLKAIKAAGGFTFVQEPSSAKYDGMPRSALASGAADYCLAPKEIAEELSRIGKRPQLRPKPRTAEPAPMVQDHMGKLFVLIRAEFGTDLTHYKHSTIDRRIERRMMLNRIGRIEDYVVYVQQHRGELQALYKDMLITVTSFFRDPEAFDALKTKVFPQLLVNRDANQPIRVWVPACATGEEAYSIAMSLVECCDERARDYRIQIFGTDLDDDSIQHARQGVYPANITLDVSPDRLNRFFVKKNNEYIVSRGIRDMIVFSRQNILRDAPFSRIDLVSCRNLLIYLQPAAQKKVLRILHYALNPSGHLVLGTSETVGDAPDLFSAVDRKNKIYAKRHVSPQTGLDLGFAVPTQLEPARDAAAPRPSLNLQGLADRKVLELYAPAGAVVSESFDILQFRGHTGPYLDPAPGAASLNILKVARFELHIELRSALNQALADHVRVTNDVVYSVDGKSCLVRLDVVPLQDPETKSRCLLVLFHRMPPPKELPVFTPGDGPVDSDLTPFTERILELERELLVTKEYLQTNIEERESTLEEIKSANEELQSSNEELQSTNEELETSKEELQSTNEELTTVNEELQNRMIELSVTNDDLHNVLAGVENPVVIVGMDLRIRRYTGSAEKLFNLVPGDIGRSIGFLDAFLGTKGLEEKVSSVIQNLAVLDEELLAANQRWYEVKISPYKTLDHTIRGALVTFVDVDVRKRATDISRDVAAYAAQFLGVIGHPLLIIDRRLRVIWASDAFFSSFQLSREETLGSTLATLGSRQFADPKLRERIEEVFKTSSVLRDHEVQLRAQDGSERAARVGASRIPATTGDRPMVLISIERSQWLSRRDSP